MELLEAIQKYWQILTASIAMVLFYANAKTTDKDHERRLLALESANKDTNVLLLQIQKDIVELKTLMKVHFKE